MLIENIDRCPWESVASYQATGPFFKVSALQVSCLFSKMKFKHIHRIVIYFFSSNNSNFFISPNTCVETIPYIPMKVTCLKLLEIGTLDGTISFLCRCAIYIYICVVSSYVHTDLLIFIKYPFSFFCLILPYALSIRIVSQQCLKQQYLQLCIGEITLGSCSPI